MNQTVTAKLKILVDPSDAELLHNTMKTYSKACDYVSKHIFNTHDLSIGSLQENLYHDIRSKYKLPSQMAQSCIRTVVAAYKTILNNQKEWIQPSFKRPQLDLVWNRDYSIVKSTDVFSVNTLNGRIKVPFFKNGFEKYFTDDCKFGTAKLIYKHGKFFLHVPVTYEIEELAVADVTNVVGIDRGIRFLAVSYDNNGKTVFFDGNIVKQKRAHYKALRSELQKRGTPSSRKRLRAIGQRENRWMEDVNHCISKALVESNPDGTLFVIEDLTNVRKATERVLVKNRYVSVSWAYYSLEQKLTYKAERKHQKVVKVNPAYTSQKCPKCGHTEASNRNKKTHTFCCKDCGYKSNDDRIGAMNLHNMGRVIVPSAVTTE